MNNNLLIKLPSLIIQYIFNLLDKDIDRIFLYLTCKQLNQKKYLWLDWFSFSRELIEDDPFQVNIPLDRFKRIQIIGLSKYEGVLKRLIRYGDKCVLEDLTIWLNDSSTPIFLQLLKHLPQSITCFSIPSQVFNHRQSFDVCRLLPWERLTTLNFNYKDGSYQLIHYTQPQLEEIMEILEQDKLQLRELEMTCRFPRAFKRLPTTLQHLSLIWYDHSLPSSTFLANLESLELVHNTLQVGQLTNGLIKLVIQAPENEEFVVGVLPDSLTDLTMKNVRGSFPPGFLPPHLKSLTLSSWGVLTVINLPSTLESLTIDSVPGSNSVFPDGLKHLTVVAFESPTILPSTLESLKITDVKSFTDTLSPSLVKSYIQLDR